MRYDHGYKPFFINVTFDACKFLKNQKHSIVKLFYNAFKDSSNLNHTCPYDVSTLVKVFISLIIIQNSQA